MKSVIANIPPTTAIGRLSLASNHLTKVPPGLTNLTKIFELRLFFNDIEIIRTGELAINSSTLISLYLNGNGNSTTIEQASLPSKLTIIGIEYVL